MWSTVTGTMTITFPSAITVTTAKVYYTYSGGNVNSHISSIDIRIDNVLVVSGGTGDYVPDDTYIAGRFCPHIFHQPSHHGVYGQPTSIHMRTGRS